MPRGIANEDFPLWCMDRRCGSRRPSAGSICEGSGWSVKTIEAPDQRGIWSTSTRPTERKAERYPPAKRHADSYRDGHISVQLMYPQSASSLSNEYVRNGYEASFGSYAIDENTHTLTHHVEGSITADLLVGKDLPRIYALTTDGRLIIHSAKSDEHWSVTWRHY